MVYYRDQQYKDVALVHQYLLPDGTIGASGIPDPKFILENGILYKFPSSRQTNPASFPPNPATKILRACRKWLNRKYRRAKRRMGLSST